MNARPVVMAKYGGRIHLAVDSRPLCGVRILTPLYFNADVSPTCVHCAFHLSLPGQEDRAQREKVALR